MNWCSVTHDVADSREVLENYLKVSRYMNYCQVLDTYKSKSFNIRIQDEEFNYHLDDDCLHHVEQDLTKKGFEVFLEELELDAKDVVEMHYEVCFPTLAQYTVLGTHDLLLVINSVQEKLTKVEGLKIKKIVSGHVDWDYTHDQLCYNDSCEFTIEVEMNLDAL